MKRIAQIVGNGIIGNGAFRAIIDYCNHIERGKFEFHFFVNENSKYTFEKEIEEFGGKVILVPAVERNPVKNFKALLKLFRQNKYDIAHSHLNTLNIFSMFAAKIAKIPVRICHNQSTAGKDGLKKNLAKFTLKPFSKAFATHLSACTEHAGRWLFNNSQFTVFRNAIDTQKFAFSQADRDEVRQELGISENTFALGHIGRFEPQKNHKFLLEIFCELQKIISGSVLVLAGEGSLLKEIQMYANDNVKFLGARSDVCRIYNAFDAFALPSNYEGLGIAGIEAQANGLPCFLSRKVPKETGITDLAQFLPLQNSAKWANAIANAPRSYSRIGYASLVASAGYDIETESKKLEQFYEEAEC